MGSLSHSSAGLLLEHAKESDAQRIADIHMDAFGSNFMLLAQFPTQSVREGLRKCLVEKAIEEIRDPKWAVLVVRNQQGHLISFAKWCLPILPLEQYEEVPWKWPEGTIMEILDEWTARVDGVAERVIGSTPCYRLSFMATDPKYERCGAASLLVHWGLELCRKEGVPAALEGTMNALPFYERHGFVDKGKITMVLNGLGPKGQSVLYEERSFVFMPDSTVNGTSDRVRELYQ